MDLAGPHWTFSLAVYAEPEVAPSCLALQDRLGVDVNVLLLALYVAGSSPVPMPASTILAADAAVAGWRDEVVCALRRLRRLLKEGPRQAPRDAAEALRSKVKEAELFAEQIEQAWLAQWFAASAAEPAGPAEDLQAVARRVAAAYAVRQRGGDTVEPLLLGACDVVGAAAEKILGRASAVD